MLWLLALASVPAAAAGLALNDYAETVFRDPLWIAFNLAFFSFVIYAADRAGGTPRSAMARTCPIASGAST